MSASRPRPGSAKRKARLDKLIERFNGRCYYCELTVTRGTGEGHPRAPTIDHMFPLSRGGKNTQGNLALSCYCCNHQKSDMTAAEFIRFRKLRMLGHSKRDAWRLVRSPCPVPTTTPLKDTSDNESAS